jgi:hypothetical protein
MVVVAHFRDLGPLVTGMIMAGRSGAGIASEIATMKVSERSMPCSPTTTPSHMLEPQLLEPQLPQPATQVTKAPNEVPYEERGG